MTGPDRARLTVMAGEGDQLFHHEAMLAVWAQVNVRTMSVPNAGHALRSATPTGWPRSCSKSQAGWTGYRVAASSGGARAMTSMAGK